MVFQLWEIGKNGMDSHFGLDNYGRILETVAFGNECRYTIGLNNDSMYLLRDVGNSNLGCDCRGHRRPLAQGSEMLL